MRRKSRPLEAVGELFHNTTTTYTPGIQYSLVFDESDANYVTTPDFGEYDGLTVACWIKVTRRVGAWRVLYNVDGWSAGWLHHQLYADNLLGFSINAHSGGNDQKGTTLFDDTVLDTWHHVATVYSSIDNTLKFYVEGILDTENSWGGNPVLLGAGRIGARSGGGRGGDGSTKYRDNALRFHFQRNCSTVSGNRISSDPRPTSQGHIAIAPREPRRGEPTGAISVTRDEHLPFYPIRSSQGRLQGPPAKNKLLAVTR